MQTRYAIQHKGRDGYPRFTRRMCGADTFDTKEKAQEWIDSFLKNNSKETLTMVYGSQIFGTVEVIEVTCYDNGELASGGA